MSGCFSAPTLLDGVPLRTARLVMRSLQAAHCAPITALLQDWAVVKHLASVPHPYEDRDAEAFLHLVGRQSAARQGVTVALHRSLDQQMIGVMGFTLLPDGGAELGYWLGQEYWRQGYGAEALRRFCRHLLGEMQLPYVMAKVHPDNGASQALLRHCGFVPQGIETCDMPSRGCSVYSPVFRLERAAWQQQHQSRPTLLVAAAALIDLDGRVLMATRPPGKMMSGLWEFPGGKVQPQETPEQALVRELAEELGVDVTESCLAPLAFASHDYDTFHLLMPLYAVRQWQGQVTAREGQGIRWVRPNAMAELPMPPADIPLVALLRDWL